MATTNSPIVIETADLHRMTIEDALQTLFDFTANHPVDIRIYGEAGDMAGEATCQRYEWEIKHTIAETNGEYSLLEVLVSLAAQTKTWWDKSRGIFEEAPNDRT